MVTASELILLITESFYPLSQVTPLKPDLRYSNTLLKDAFSTLGHVFTIIPILSPELPWDPLSASSFPSSHLQALLCSPYPQIFLALLPHQGRLFAPIDSPSSKMKTSKYVSLYWLFRKYQFKKVYKLQYPYIQIETPLIHIIRIYIHIFSNHFFSPNSITIVSLTLEISIKAK